MAGLRSRRQQGVTLVELLVVMVIMAIVSTMIIGTWIAVSRAYSFSSVSDRQQDFARQAVSRMAREIRDAQAVLGSTTPAFVKAYPYEVQFYSTFNTVDADDPSTTPRLTRFIYRDGAIYRELAVAGGDFTTPPSFSTVLVKNVVNAQVQPNRDLFTYAAFDGSGNLYTTGTLTATSAIVNVKISLLVDLNPGKSPKYMTVETTVQPRNVRHL